MDHPLASWKQGTAKTAILDFVGSVSARESGWTVVSIKDDWDAVFNEGGTR
jgi:hypothetical protein